jgi:hypothetical protein
VQSVQSIFPHLLGGTMATSQTCCHLPGKMLNSAAKCADKARILEDETVQILAWRRRKRDKKKRRKTR